MFAESAAAGTFAMLKKRCSESNCANRASINAIAAESKSALRSTTSAFTTSALSNTTSCPASPRGKAKARIKSLCMLYFITGQSVLLDPFGHGQYIHIRTVLAHQLESHRQAVWMYSHRNTNGWNASNIGLYSKNIFQVVDCRIAHHTANLKGSRRRGRTQYSIVLLERIVRPFLYQPSCRLCLSEEGIVVSRAQYKGPQHDSALYFYAKPFASTFLVNAL